MTGPDLDRVGFFRDGDLVSAEHARALKLPADWVLIKHPNGQDFLLFKSGSEKHHRHAKALAFQKSLGQP